MQKMLLVDTLDYEASQVGAGTMIGSPVVGGIAALAGLLGGIRFI
jgi:hypothetical protein